MSSEALLDSMRVAVEASPDDVSLRLHYAELLADAGRRDDSVRQAAAVLQRDPTNGTALELITGRAGAGTTGAAGSAGTHDASSPAADPPAIDPEAVLEQLDAELEESMPSLEALEQDQRMLSAFDVERAGLKLADVGGMAEVKARLEAAVLAPLRNPELRRVYGKSLRGGLLLYGPPGCGKTFIARALAGEIGAQFISVSLADVLDMYVGQSERNVHELFALARRNAPCVVFLDEIDALGHRRTQMRNNAARGSVNQLLTEMDGVGAANDGVYVLGATNHPWDVDVALRRPGRFDRMVLVLPPDEQARESILGLELRDRPAEKLDLRRLVRATDGYSGADLAYLVELAAEAALVDSARTGTIRRIEMRDFEAALADTRPSVGPWFEAARNVAQFGNTDGSYDQLAAYLRKRRML
jgi:SpoVK/Ycf46/Vps4 family AAA+-type ATPase